jgi:hypothetical protein
MQQLGECPEWVANILNAVGSGAPHECLLCGGAPYSLGAFCPEDSEAWGPEPGKQRMIFYALCKKCFGDQPRSASAVEKILRHEQKDTIVYQFTCPGRGAKCGS